MKFKTGKIFKKISFKEAMKKMFIIKKEDTKKQIIGKIVNILVLLVFITALIISGYLIYQKITNAIDDKEIIAAISSDYKEDPPEEEKIITPTTDPSLFNSNGIYKKLEGLYKINNELVGLITIPGTGLKRPVMQSNLSIDNGGNAFYLKKSMQLKAKPQGEVFADCRATVQEKGKERSDIVTLYGHSTTSKMYFENIFGYSEKDFYVKHPTITFDTIYDGTEIYKVLYYAYVPVYTGNGVTDEQFNYHDYVDVKPRGFYEYIKEMEKRSYFTTGVDVEYGDKLLVLSTCDRELDALGQSPYRKVLVARRVRNGESAKVDTSKYQENTDMITPKAWQDKNGKLNIYK